MRRCEDVKMKETARNYEQSDDHLKNIYDTLENDNQTNKDNQFSLFFDYSVSSKHELERKKNNDNTYKKK